MSATHLLVSAAAVQFKIDATVGRAECQGRDHCFTAGPLMRSTGPVERAVRAAAVGGSRLSTPSRGAPFTVAWVDDRGIVLLLREQDARTPLTWECLEGIDPFLASRGWVEIGSRYETQADPDTLDGYLKGFLKRATAGWVAAVLERAGLVEIDRGRPARVRLLRTAKEHALT